jgi:hypothetical protein
MSDLLKEQLSLEDAFWVTWYFLKNIYDSNDGKFDLSDILSASEPFFDVIKPADSAMTEYWLKAFIKFKEEGIPPVKILK